MLRTVISRRGGDIGRSAIGLVSRFNHSSQDPSRKRGSLYQRAGPRGRRLRFQCKFDVERAQAEDDLVIARDSAVVLVDPASVPFLAGSEVDFVDDLIGASFRVVNPNATASCGCGTIFRSEQASGLNYLLTLFAHDRIN